MLVYESKLEPKYATLVASQIHSQVMKFLERKIAKLNSIFVSLLDDDTKKSRYIHD